MNMCLNMKKTLSLLLALMMLLAVLTGCAGSGSTVTNVDPTDDTTATDLTQPAATDPADPAPTEPLPTDPDATKPADPMDPTEPEATDVPDETVTDPTAEPDVPDVTVPPETADIPDATDAPDDVAHVHSYAAKAVPATCTAKGYTLHSCACGHSYKDSYTAAKGHSYTASTAKATFAAQGYTLHQCSCGDSYKDNYTAAGEHDYKLVETREAPNCFAEGWHAYECSGCGDSYKEYFRMTQEQKEQYCAEIAAAMLKYINQFRVEQGDTEATVLPGLTLVAEYRAVQLTDNFRHSFADSREAFAYYQYGEYVDATEYGDDASKSYYTANAKEAICGTSCMSPDSMGEQAATLFRNSSGHWSYVGSSDFPYIAVGVCCTPNSGWVVCVLQTKTNYG